MSNMKRTAKSKFLSEELEDFINESQYVKDSPKNKKVQKRNKIETFVEEEMPKLGDNQAVAKRRKVDAVSYGNNTQQKVLKTMSQQIQSRKFHSAGQGLGTINMLSPTGETHIKKLVKQYEKLKSEGVPENELVEKCTAAVDSQRQPEAPPTKIIVKNPESATAQVLAEADLKNIFNKSDDK
ncbi:hypothetical protein MSG28_004203 [Choristoneura fumiferana]|uniref:Uncharacterized protein n=1 Tax=Choristoneura fumiferana TaxID=7141 RepID=A0ACC0KIL9_CHOFU|nr:hypothetical protein MSG28_004203 [Choristoneura fumiferana]